jgi:hypothetical protein
MHTVTTQTLKKVNNSKIEIIIRKIKSIQEVNKNPIEMQFQANTGAILH